jgi:hypothetical protein
MQKRKKSFGKKEENSKDKKRRKNILWIIPIILAVCLIAFFFLKKQNLLFGPENYIYTFMSNLDENGADYKIVAPDNYLFLEESIINEFSSTFSISKINESEFNGESNRIFIGLPAEFKNTPYKDKLKNIDDGIIVFNSTSNNLYAYAVNIDSLSLLINFLKNYTENQANLSFPAIKLFGSEASEFFLEPPANAIRTINPLSIGKESEIKIDVTIARNLDNLLIAEYIPENLNITSAEDNYLFYSSNLIVWFLQNVQAGEYSFRYKVIPTSSGNAELRGKVGIKIGEAEEDYIISGQSNVNIPSPDISQNLGSGGGGGGSGGGGGAQTTSKEISYISYSELTAGKSFLLKTSSVNFEFENKEIHYLKINNIESNSLSLLIDNMPVNLQESQSTKLSIKNKDYYELYIKLEKLEKDSAVLYIKKISEKIIAPSDLSTQAEKPLSINPKYANKFRNIIIISALVLIVLIAGIVIARKYNNQKKTKSA